MKLHPVSMGAGFPEARAVAGGADRQRRRDGLGLLQVLSIADAWGLSQPAVATLLGTTVRTLQRWKKEASETRMLDVGSDTVERMSYLLGISKALTILFPTPANRVHWLRHPNTSTTFNGQVPLERMLAGQVVDLYVVRHHLDGMRG